MAASLPYTSQGPTPPTQGGARPWVGVKRPSVGRVVRCPAVAPGGEEIMKSEGGDALTKG